MSSYSYGWETKNCEMLLPFVCEVWAGDEAPTTLEPPPPPPLIPCQVGSLKNFLKNLIRLLILSNSKIIFCVFIKKNVFI